MLRKAASIALEPRGLLDSRICGHDSEAGYNRVTRAGDDSEQNRIRMRYHRPIGNLPSRVCWNIAEEEVGDVPLKDDDLAVVR
jgi:hypothetical protein